ncbi:hypothetical protein M3697_17320 [Janibacter melonis]|uniref:hypothetical protein n=1 Tax=Janibacter melonis TaxID=262209 RepID=UPI0020437022|nr:hypothetical protein [Janibacter melonis]MCM3556843.1 hypothetical protein [Janibacter melonis]
MGELVQASRVMPRLLRARWVWRPGVGVAIATMLIMLAYVVLSSWGLSREQVIERDFSGREAVVRLSAPVSPGPSTPLRAVYSAAGDAPVVLYSPGVRLTQDPQQRLLFQESDWSSAPFGFELVSGSWPNRPGEVVVTAGLDPGRGEDLSLLSGTVAMRVVGVVDDAYSNDPRILAAPGTWQSLPSKARTARTGLVASVSVLATSTQAPSLVKDLKAQRLSARADRATAVTDEQTWLAASPFSFTVPALLVPMLVVALGVSAGRARQRALVRRVVEVGGQQRTALGMVLVALLVVVTVGLCAGALGGWGAGHLARVVAARWNDRALAPYPALVGPATLIAASCTAGLAASMLQLRQPRAAAPRSARTVHRTARQWAALVSVGIGAAALMRMSSAGHAMLVGACALVAMALLAPEVVAAVARRIDRPTPHLRLGSRLISADRGATAEVILTMMVLALPLTTMVLLTTTGSAARAEALAPVGPGQLLVAGEGGLASPAPSAVRKTVTNALATTPDAVPTTLLVTESAWYEAGLGTNASVIAVATAADVEKVLGTPLTAEQRTTLEEGGALVWEPDGQLTIDGRPATPPIKTTTYRPMEEWSNQAGAVMLAEPARSRGITLRRGGTLYAAVSPGDVDRAQAAIREQGLDQSLLHRHHAPSQLLPPTALMASALLLVALMLGITAISSHTRTASLRRQYGRLVAIGADRSVVRRVQLVTQAVITSLATIAACSITVVAAATMLLRLSGTQINPPWVLMLALICSLITAQVLASLLALRGLRPELAREA